MEGRCKFSLGKIAVPRAMHKCLAQISTIPLARYRFGIGLFHGKP